MFGDSYAHNTQELTGGSFSLEPMPSWAGGWEGKTNLLRCVHLFGTTIGPQRYVNFDSYGRPKERGGAIRAEVTSSAALRVTNVGSEPIAVCRAGDQRVQIHAGQSAEVACQNTIFLAKSFSRVAERCAPPYMVEIAVNGARIQLPLQIGKLTPLGRHLTNGDRRISGEGVSIWWHPAHGAEIVDDNSYSGIYHAPGDRVAPCEPYHVEPGKALYLGKPEWGYKLRLVPINPLGIPIYSSTSRVEPGTSVQGNSFNYIVCGFDALWAEAIIVPDYSDPASQPRKLPTLPSRFISQELLHEYFIVLEEGYISTCRDMQTGLFYFTKNLNQPRVELVPAVEVHGIKTYDLLAFNSPDPQQPRPCGSAPVDRLPAEAPPAISASLCG